MTTLKHDCAYVGEPSLMGRRLHIEDLSQDQRRVLSDLEDHRRWANVLISLEDPTIEKARYFIYGATGIDLQDDAKTKALMYAAYHGTQCEVYA